MSSFSSLSSSSTCTHDPLNQARIQGDETHSVLISPTQTHTKRSKKSLPTQTDQFDHRQSILQLLNSASKQQIVTPQKSTSNVKRRVDLTKTMTIKGKKGKLYEQVCPVCLAEYSPPIGVLSCRHKFCFDCIEMWSKTSTVCPCCRKKFNKILKKVDENKGPVQTIQVQQKQMEFHEQDYFICYVCGCGDNQNVLLICDMCDFNCCHIYCDPALNNTIPEGDWFCRNCQPHLQSTQLMLPTQHIQITEISQISSQQENKPVAARTRSRAVESQAQLFRRLRRRR